MAKCKKHETEKVTYGANGFRYLCARCGRNHDTRQDLGETVDLYCPTCNLRDGHRGRTTFRRHRRTRPCEYCPECWDEIVRKGLR